jgi:hypothetical protein
VDQHEEHVDKANLSQWNSSEPCASFIASFKIRVGSGAFRGQRVPVCRPHPRASGSEWGAVLPANLELFDFAQAIAFHQGLEYIGGNVAHAMKCTAGAGGMFSP